jgi:hypothetical protein
VERLVGDEGLDGWGGGLMSSGGKAGEVGLGGGV